MRDVLEWGYTPGRKDPLFHAIGVAHGLRYLSLRAIVTRAILLFPAYARGNQGLTEIPGSWYTPRMRKSLFKDLGPVTIEGLGHPMALEERIRILNERMKSQDVARKRVDGRIIAAEKRTVRRISKAS